MTQIKNFPKSMWLLWLMEKLFQTIQINHWMKSLLIMNSLVNANFLTNMKSIWKQFQLDMRLIWYKIKIYCFLSCFRVGKRCWIMRILSHFCLNAFSFFISSYILNCTLALWYKIKSGRSIKLNPIELLSK